MVLDQMYLLTFRHCEKKRQQQTAALSLFLRHSCFSLSPHSPRSLWCFLLWSTTFFCTFKTASNAWGLSYSIISTQIFQTAPLLRVFPSSISDKQMHRSFPSARPELCVRLNLAGLICSLQTCRTDKREEERKQRERRGGRERDSARPSGNEQKQHWKEGEQVSEMVSACHIMTKTAWTQRGREREAFGEAVRYERDRGGRVERTTRRESKPALG